MSKSRNGWVSNSSSSSFIIKTKYISEYQKELLLNPVDKFKEVCLNLYEELDEYDKEEDYDNDFDKYLEERLANCWLEDAEDWSVCEDYNIIRFSTIMDNFDYLEYVSLVGLDKYVEDIDD